MGLRDVGETLPPGFRFYPSDEELVCHYLHKKIANQEAIKGTLVEIDLHTCEPWELPEVAKLNKSEWYFFSFRDRKYATGFRTNRATTSGYWKATGKDRVIYDPKTREIVGMRKTLVFYRNRAPNGIKTGWIMHEFRLESPHMPPKEDWVLCRVFHKNKGENNADNPIVDNQTTISSSSPPFDNQKYNPQICRCHQIQSISSTNPSISSSSAPNNSNALSNYSPSLNPNNLLKECASSSFSLSDLINPSTKDGADDYGFLWNDMDFEDISNNKLGGGAAHHDFLPPLIPQCHDHLEM